MAGGINAIGNLMGKVDANGALLVSLSGTFTGQLLGEVSATVPAYSFVGDTNTGYGSSAADTLAMFAGGTTPRVTISSSAVTSTVPYLAPDGAVGTPGLAFADDPNTGWYRAGNTGSGAVLRAAVNGLLVATFDAASGFYLPMDGASIFLGATSDVSILRTAADTFGPAAGDAYGLASKAWIRTAPTIASGFGTSPSVVASNGTAAFTVNVGTGGTASAGVITLPTATTGWILSIQNLTAQAANRASVRTCQTASTTTSATIQNQNVATGAATAWAASDVLSIIATAY